MVWWWAMHLMGTDNGSGPWYLFWSGFGANLGELTIVAGIFSLYWKHTCHVGKCWRLGRLPTKDGWTVCHRHHPDGSPTADDLKEA